MVLEKINLSKKHLLMLMFPTIFLVILFIFKSTIVNNLISYFEMNYLSKYTISDEFVRYSTVQFPKKEKNNISEIVAILPVSKIQVAIPVGTKIQRVSQKTSHKVSFIYVGVNKKFVEIDGNFYSEGDFISQGEKIVRIEKDKVLIDISGRKKWLYILD